jgi:hypothetical protein
MIIGNVFRIFSAKRVKKTRAVMKWGQESFAFFFFSVKMRGKPTTVYMLMAVIH